METKTTAADHIIEDLKMIAVRELELTEAQIARLQPESSLTETLNLDSLAQATFVFAIEDHYGITFELEDMAKIKSLQDLVDMVRKIHTFDLP